MKNYASPKHALLDAGRIDTIGRGRISRDNNAWLDEQVSSGAFTVSGMSLKASTGPTPAPPTVERVKASETGVVDVREPTRDLSSLECNADAGMKAVCWNCNSSLTYCPCESPRTMVNGSLGVVHFKPRTHALPKNPWG